MTESTANSTIRTQPFFTYRPMIKIVKKYPNNPELLQSITDGINNYVDQMYELFPYHSLMCSVRSLLRTRCTSYIVDHIDKNGQLIYNTNYGEFKYMVDAPNISYTQNIDQQTIDELISSNIITATDLIKINTIKTKSLTTVVCTNVLKSSFELASIKTQIDDEISTKLLIDKSQFGWDNHVYFMNRMLFIIKTCKQKQGLYILAYNEAKKLFDKLYNNFGVKDYLYKEVSFRKFPTTETKWTYKGIIINYDHESATNILPQYDTIAKKYSSLRDEETFKITGKKRVLLRYFVDTTEYTFDDDDDVDN